MAFFSISAKSKIGQAALEYMIIILIGLILITPVVLEGNKKIADFRSTTTALEATDVLNKISDSAMLVHAQGAPAKIVVETKFPKNVKYVNLSNSGISITVGMEWGDSDFIKKFDFNVTGNVSAESGLRKIKVEAVNINNRVWVNISNLN